VRTEVEAHQDFATQQGISIVLDEDLVSPGELVTLGRPSSIGTVIANLLTNAIRHSPEGSSVGVGITVDGPDCRITVTDQGEGIAAEHLPRIFERFYRVDNARSRDGGGTGLGLSIARHTMRAHGGDITVWSQPGVGSSFTLTFPIVEEKSPGKGRKREKRAARKTKGGDARPKKERTK
jgi:two-component system sensor histidine kinase SenX3